MVQVEIGKKKIWPDQVRAEIFIFTLGRAENAAMRVRPEKSGPCRLLTHTQNMECKLTSILKTIKFCSKKAEIKFSIYVGAPSKITNKNIQLRKTKHYL